MHHVPPPACLVPSSAKPPVAQAIRWESRCFLLLRPPPSVTEISTFYLLSTLRGVLFSPPPPPSPCSRPPPSLSLSLQLPNGPSSLYAHSLLHPCNSRPRKVFRMEISPSSRLAESLCAFKTEVHARYTSLRRCTRPGPAHLALHHWPSQVPESQSPSLSWDGRKAGSAGPCRARLGPVGAEGVLQ